MSEARDKFVDSQGLPIHYLEWGEPAGEPLVLVHGYLDLAHSWKPFVASLQERLGKSAWIIAPDCRGHGDSGWIGAGGYYHFPDYVFDLECVIRALGVTQLKLIGHSMGGTISFLYAGTFPKRVSQLVLIEGLGPPGMNFSDAPLRMEKWITEVRERGRRHFRVYTSVEAGANQLRQTNPRLNDAWALELARTGMKQNDQGRWIFSSHRMSGTYCRRQGEPANAANRQTRALRRHTESPSGDHRSRRSHGASRQSGGVGRSYRNFLEIVTARLHRKGNENIGASIVELDY